MFMDAAARERPFLWGLAYRITGVAADADDVVQDAFTRLLKNPPSDRSAPLRPWLVRVTSRLAIDVLRHRKKARYIGPFLPSPVEISSTDISEPGARYAAWESLTFAFLLALEALAPKQRAVLVLRDVLDMDVRQTAEALSMTEANVKVAHLRARNKLRDYDSQRVDTSQAAQARVQEALYRLMTAVAANDIAGVAALLSEQVVLLSDGGGQYLAARKPVRGRRSVSLFLVKTQRGAQVVGGVRLAAGLPVLIARAVSPRAGIARKLVLGIDVNEQGQITALYNVLADRKLTAVTAPP
jgi:RNA polymerase sigma-70 factor (ECF subfamily)